MPTQAVCCTATPGRYTRSLLSLLVSRRDGVRARAWQGTWAPRYANHAAGCEMRPFNLYSADALLPLCSVCGYVRCSAACRTGQVNVRGRCRLLLMLLMQLHHLSSCAQQHLYQLCAALCSGVHDGARGQSAPLLGEADSIVSPPAAVQAATRAQSCHHTHAHTTRR